MQFCKSIAGLLILTASLSVLADTTASKPVEQSPAIKKAMDPAVWQKLMADIGSGQNMQTGCLACHEQTELQKHGVQAMPNAMMNHMPNNNMMTMNPMMGMTPMMGGMNPMMGGMNPMMGGMNPMMGAMNPMMGGMNPMMGGNNSQIPQIQAQPQLMNPDQYRQYYQQWMDKMSKMQQMGKSTDSTTGNQ